MCQNIATGFHLHKWKFRKQHSRYANFPLSNSCIRMQKFTYLSTYLSNLFQKIQSKRVT